MAYFILGSTNGDVTASMILNNRMKGIKIRLTRDSPILSKLPLRFNVSEKIEKQKHNTGQATINATKKTSVKRTFTSVDSNIFFSFDLLLVSNSVYIQPHVEISKNYLSLATLRGEPAIMVSSVPERHSWLLKWTAIQLNNKIIIKTS